MSIPETREELNAHGYRYTGDARCRACLEVIEFWETPHGKRIPMRMFEERDVTGKLIYKRRPHFADCPFAKRFRRPPSKS